MRCAVCDGDGLAHLIDLPNFPLTGIFLDQPGPPQTHDQGFLFCEACGHGQLTDILPPETLYGPDYWHRSSKSPIATAGNDFLYTFIASIQPRLNFKFIVEVGCNDLYLLKEFDWLRSRLVGIDPIWKGKESDYLGKIEVIGKFIEDVEISDLGGKPDLIISAHTFEHLANPRRELERIMEFAADDALFVIEVPCFDSLLRNYRFDQVFHQHTQYFSLSSMQEMIVLVGGEYITHTINYDYWGGTMLTAFRKRSAKRHVGPRAPTARLVESHYNVFLLQMAELVHTINDIKDEPIYGYGAAQMVPTLAYHMGSDLSFLESILDDDPERGGLYWPGLAVQTQHNRTWSVELAIEGSTILITALDSLRPIMQRVIPMKPRNILVPLNIL
jgi:hypothetical protein